MKSVFLAAAAVALACSAPAAAEPADVAAAVAAEGRAEQDTSLDESRQPAQVLAFLGLEQGDIALDMLAGGGYYTELMARAVGPEGYVLGQNNPPLIERFNLAQVFEARGYGGERVPNAAQFNIPFGEFVLPPDSIDFTLFHMVFHDLWYIDEENGFPEIDPALVIARIYRATRPGGIVGIVDHVGVNAEDPRAESAATHRISPDVVRAVMTEAGFVLEEEAGFLRNPEDDGTTSVFDPSIRGRTDRFVYRFRKPESGAID